LLADAQAGITYEADQVGVFAEEFNPLLFAESQLSQAIGSFRAGVQLFDAN